MAENFIGTLGSEEAPSYYGNYNIGQKLVLEKIISASPEEHFQLFLKHQNFESYSDCERTIFGRVVKTALYRSRRTFSGIFFSTLSESFSDFGSKIFGRFVKTAFYMSRETYWRKFHEN